MKALAWAHLRRGPRPGFDKSRALRAPPGGHPAGGGAAAAAAPPLRRRRCCCHQSRWQAGPHCCCRWSCGWWIGAAAMGCSERQHWAGGGARGGWRRCLAAAGGGSPPQAVRPAQAAAPPPIGQCSGSESRPATPHSPRGPLRPAGRASRVSGSDHTRTLRLGGQCTGRCLHVEGLGEGWRSPWTAVATGPRWCWRGLPQEGVLRVCNDLNLLGLSINAHAVRQSEQKLGPGTAGHGGRRPMQAPPVLENGAAAPRSASFSCLL